MDCMDAKAMRAMLEVEGNVLIITIKDLNDPSTFIMPTNG